MKKGIALFTSFTFVLTLCLLSNTANAAPLKIDYTVEPIAGYTLERKDNPTRTKLVLTYGARVTAGYKILSGEGEYTRGSSDEEMLGLPLQRIEETSERVRVGIRSTYDWGLLLSATLRGGAEAGKRHTESTISGVKTVSDSPTMVDPYVGIGAGFHLGSQISLSVEALVTIKDTKDLKKNEYSATTGLRIAFNTK